MHLNTCRNTWLKYRLLRDYPDKLRYHKSKKKNISELVTCADALLSEVVDADEHILRDISSSSRTGSTSNGNGSENASLAGLSIPGPGFVSYDQTKVHIANAALHIRNKIQNSEKPYEHPPSASDLTLQAAKRIVPPVLFNTVALSAGLIQTLPEDETEFAETRSEQKVLSVCQDIINLSGKATPKTMALGLTIRNATGSRYLLELLNGFGHVPSYDTVLRAETGIAYQQLETKEEGFIPPGFEVSKITVLVYDNIDFLEETLSGAGTSHYTNGIMFQVSETGSQIQVTARTSIPGTKKTFTPQKSEIAPYFLYKKEAPGEQLVLSADLSQLLEASQHKNLCYAWLKETDGSTYPAFTGFNIKTSSPLPKSVVHYLPIIEASPTDMATVRHILKSAKEQAELLKCPSIIVVFDQAIYAKAQMIRWSDEEYQDILLPRLGEFHTVMSFMTAIGKRFELSAFEDILVESGVISAGSIKGVLAVHKYNRSIYAHKCMFEALLRIQIEEFLSTIPADDSDSVTALTEILLQQHTEGSNNPPDHELIKAFHQHVIHKSAESAVYAFWNSYITMVGVSLSFIRATRTADFNLHLASLRAMLPWFFAYDRVNYSRSV